MKKNITITFYYFLYFLIFLALPFNVGLVEGDGGGYSGVKLNIRNANSAIINPLLVPTQMNLMVPPVGNIPNNIGLNNQGILPGVLGVGMNIPVDPIIINNPPPVMNAPGLTGAIPMTPTMNSINNPPALAPAMNAPGLINLGAITSPMNSNNSLFALSPINALMQIGAPPIFPSQGMGMARYNPGINSLFTGNITHLGGFMGNNPINIAPIYNTGSYPFGNTHNIPMPYPQNVPFNMSYNSPSNMALPHIMNSPNPTSLLSPPPIMKQPDGQVNNISNLVAPFKPPPPVEVEGGSIINPASQPANSEELAVGNSAFSRTLNFNGQRHTNEIIVMFRPGASGAVIDGIHKKCGAQWLKLVLMPGFI